MNNKRNGHIFFVNPGHVETVVLLSHTQPDSHINVKVEFDSCPKVKAFVATHNGTFP